MNMPFRRVHNDRDRDKRSDSRRGLGAGLVFFFVVAGFASWLTVIEVQTNSTVSAVHAEQLANHSRSEQTSAAAVSAVFDFAAIETQLETFLIAEHLSLPKGESIDCVPNDKTFTVKCSFKT